MPSAPDDWLEWELECIKAEYVDSCLKEGFIILNHKEFRDIFDLKWKRYHTTIEAYRRYVYNHTIISY